MPLVKKLSQKRLNAMLVRLTDEHDKKMHQLSVSVNMKPAVLAERLLRNCLDSSQFLVDFQKAYNHDPAYWVTPYTENGQTTYVIHGSGAVR